jgi:hypothetical protein
METTDLNFGIVVFRGALLGGLFLMLAYRAGRYTRHVLAATLVLAALAYVAFSLHAGAGGAWLAIELLGLAFYGAFAVRGVSGSHRWMAAGWLLHPVWDLAVHHFGPADAYSPDRYEIACLGFDFVVAAVVALRGAPAPGANALDRVIAGATGRGRHE